MTPEELAAIRDRAEKATPGPWDWRDEQYPGQLVHRKTVAGLPVHPLNVLKCAPDWGPTPEDAEFVAAARTDIPALLDHIDMLTAQLDAVRGMHRPVEDEIGEWYCLNCIEGNPWEKDSVPYPCSTIQALEGDPNESQ